MNKDQECALRAQKALIFVFDQVVKQTETMLSFANQGHLTQEERIRYKERLTCFKAAIAATEDMIFAWPDSEVLPSISEERRQELLDQGRETRKRLQERMEPLLNPSPDKMNRRLK